jgi:hypothetical protein
LCENEILTAHARGKGGMFFVDYSRKEIGSYLTSGPYWQCYTRLKYSSQYDLDLVHHITTETIFADEENSTVNITFTENINGTLKETIYKFREDDYLRLTNLGLQYAYQH